MMVRRSVGLAVVIAGAVLSVATSESLPETPSASADARLRVFLEAPEESFQLTLRAEPPLSDVIDRNPESILWVALLEVDPEAAGLNGCEAAAEPFGVERASWRWDDEEEALPTTIEQMNDSSVGKLVLLEDQHLEPPFVCEAGVCTARGLLTVARDPAAPCAAVDLEVAGALRFAELIDTAPDLNGLVVVIERLDDPAP